MEKKIKIHAWILLYEKIPNYSISLFFYRFR
jgi:hypothetical protein